MSQINDNLSAGNQLYLKGDYSGAIELYQKAIKNNENPTLSWFNLGNAYYQSGNSQKTVSCYEMALTEAPDFTRGWVNLGILYYELEDRSASIAALEKALMLNSEDSRVYMLLATAYKDLEHYSNAVICLEKTLELDSNRVEAYLMLSDIALLTGDKREALSWLSKYPETGPRAFDVLLLSGGIKVEIGDTAGGLVVFRRCIQKAPENMSCWLKLVELLYHSGAVYSAILESQRAVKINPTFGALALLAGQVSFENGYYEYAEEFFRVACNNKEPDGTVGLSNLLKVYERFNDVRGMARINSIFDTIKR